MRFLTAFALALGLSAGAAAQTVDPATTSFPWKNGATRDAQYTLGDHKNVVHVLEAWTLTCGSCSANAPAVQELAAEYAGNERVQFIDLGLDANERDYTRWIAAHHPTHPVVQDEGRKVFEVLRHVDTVPQGFVLTCEGQLAGWVHGSWTVTVKAELRAAIAKALRTTCE